MESSDTPKVKQVISTGTKLNASVLFQSLHASPGCSPASPPPLSTGRLPSSGQALFLWEVNLLEGLKAPRLA